MPFHRSSHPVLSSNLCGARVCGISQKHGLCMAKTCTCILKFGPFGESTFSGCCFPSFRFYTLSCFFVILFYTLSCFFVILFYTLSCSLRFSFIAVSLFLSFCFIQCLIFMILFYNLSLLFWVYFVVCFVWLLLGLLLFFLGGGGITLRLP